MSDLAPFVAAVLRDKVVGDLMEENKQLRGDATLTRALRGFNRNHSVAVVGPSHAKDDDDPIVYSVSEYHPEGPVDPVDGSFWYVGPFFDGSSKVNDLTLGDLPTTRILINGEECEFRIRFWLTIDSSRDFCDPRRAIPIQGVESLDDVLIPNTEGYVGFELVINYRNLETIDFTLGGDIPKEKWFEFAGVNTDQWLANPVSVDNGREVSIEDVIDFFGPKTLVLLEEGTVMQPYY